MHTSKKEPMGLEHPQSMAPLKRGGRDPQKDAVDPIKEVAKIPEAKTRSRQVKVECRRLQTRPPKEAETTKMRLI